MRGAREDSRYEYSYIITNRAQAYCTSSGVHCYEPEHRIILYNFNNLILYNTVHIGTLKHIKRAFEKRPRKHTAVWDPRNYVIHIICFPW